MKISKIENRNDVHKDNESKAILVNDCASLEQYKKNKKRILEEKTLRVDINKIIDRIDNLEKSIHTILNLLENSKKDG